MKKRRIVFAAVLCMMMVLSACGNRMTPQTMDGVKAVIVEKGLYDESKAYTNSRITGDTLAMLLTNQWSVSFSEYKTVGNCESEYAFGKLMLDGAVETKDSNYSIYEGDQGDDVYKIIVRVDDTLLVIAGPKSAKEELQDLARDIGYYK